MFLIACFAVSARVHKHQTRCGAPYYNYSIMYPQNLIIIIKAQILRFGVSEGSTYSTILYGSGCRIFNRCPARNIPQVVRLQEASRCVPEVGVAFGVSVLGVNFCIPYS